jgi:hypothetical protein
MWRAPQPSALALTCAVVAAVAAPATAAAGPPAAAAPGASHDDVDDLMRLLAARRHGEVSFVEQDFLAILQHPRESSGELVYDAPDHLEQRTLEPLPQTLVLDGDRMTMRRGERTRQVDLRRFPQVAPLVTALRAMLAGDRAALERAFRIDYSGTLAHWSLVLVPQDPQVARNVVRVDIDGMNEDLRHVEIRQPDGDRSRMTLRAHTGP